MSERSPLRVGLYGNNGHQIQQHLVDHSRARLVAVADVPDSALPDALRDEPGITRYATLAEMLGDGSIDLVSLCSPRRADQAADAIACLEAGKHVYAEKPAALTEAELDQIVAAAAKAGRVFREMAETAFVQPYRAVREAVARGAVGRVVQVLAQKSYPMHDGRPQDEAVDGGLLMQVGVHAVRMVEHVAQVRVEQVSALETTLSNPGEGELRMACSLQMRGRDGELATVICNYLNPPLFPRWGNEMLRIFGTEGFIEITDGGQHTRFMTRDRDRGALGEFEPSWRYHDLLFAQLQGEAPMPLTSEEELRPTRIVIRAKQSVS